MMLLRAITAWALTSAAMAGVVEEDRQLDGYKYIEDLTGYYASYKTCFRVKISNNDDDAEGNSYFYNGKYYAKYQRYVAFNLCNKCGSNCDESTGYVTDMDNYVQTMAGFVKDYCEECDAKCGRRLEDEPAEDNIDCSTCASQCSIYSSASDGGNDEANYLNCQAGYNDGSTQFYQSPTCHEGTIVMGLFYDNACTVKSDQKPEMQFDYHTFRTIEKMCFDCSYGDDACLYDSSTHCYGSAAVYGDDVCKKYSEAVRTVTYSARKKKWNVLPGIIAFLVIGVIGSFLVHTYYIRHRDKKTIPLAHLDHGSNEASPQDASTLPALT